MAVFLFGVFLKVCQAIQEKGTFTKNKSHHFCIVAAHPFFNTYFASIDKPFKFINSYIFASSISIQMSGQASLAKLLYQENKPGRILSKHFNVCMQSVCSLLLLEQFQLAHTLFLSPVKEVWKIFCFSFVKRAN